MNILKRKAKAGSKVGASTTVIQIKPKQTRRRTSRPIECRYYMGPALKKVTRSSDPMRSLQRTVMHLSCGDYEAVSAQIVSHHTGKLFATATRRNEKITINLNV